MSSPILRSFVYLSACGGIGYALMLLVAPSDEKKRAIAASGGNSDLKSKKALFMQKLKEAQTDTPIYLKRQPIEHNKTEEKEDIKSSKREIN